MSTSHNTPQEQPDPNESGWSAIDALRFYAEGRHFDVVEGRTRILDTGAVASDALKGASESYGDMKGLTQSETAPRVFPVIYWQSKDAKPGPMTIPWEVAEYAYSVYSSKYGRSQSLERLRERGGFHASELDDFVPDWRERASRITQLERELAQAQSDLVEVDAANVRLARDLQSARSASGDSARLDWLDQNVFHREMDDFDRKVEPNRTMWVFFGKPDVQGSARRIIDAAMDAVDSFANTEEKLT